LRYPSHTLRKLKTAQTITIIGFGDSLTFGWCADKGYLDFLYEILSQHFADAYIDIINCGIPGDTAAGGLARLSSDVIKKNPDCVIIQFGLNDAFTGCSVEQFRQTMSHLIDKLLKETQADLLLTTSVWFDMPSAYNHAELFYHCMEEIAEDRALPIVRLHAQWKQAVDDGLDQNKLVQADGVHPTREGYRVMAEIIGEVFTRETL
jgi:acyl-CoA thioesterase I